MKAYLGIDLGTTNMKAALYDEQMRPIDSESMPVRYDRTDGFVEFDADVCFDALIDMLGTLAKRCGATEIPAGIRGDDAEGDRIERKNLEQMPSTLRPVVGFPA